MFLLDLPDKVLGIGLRIISILVIAVCLFYIGRCTKPQPTLSNKLPDTVFIEKPIEKIIVKEVQVPRYVNVHSQDFKLREKVENERIILGVQKKKNTLEVQSITPIGVSFTDVYTLDNELDFKINSEGQVEYDTKKARKKRFWQKVKNTSLDVLKVGGGLALGLLL